MLARLALQRCGAPASARFARLVSSTPDEPAEPLAESSNTVAMYKPSSDEDPASIVEQIAYKYAGSVDPPFSCLTTKVMVLVACEDIFQKHMLHADLNAVQSVGDLARYWTSRLRAEQQAQAEAEAHWTKQHPLNVSFDAEAELFEGVRVRPVLSEWCVRNGMEAAEGLQKSDARRAKRLAAKRAESAARGDDEAPPDERL
ncbi:hypothetical protein AB1Y20_008954 [Prymnesium parvum]|uniref:Uncharacterized protein n=1 Tax=Prymnesium parvum TaxID=97485 RepID=A0AB34K354_PRYPA